MSRTFNGSSQYMKRTTINVTGTFSVAGWVKATRATAFENICSLGGSVMDAGASFWRLDQRGDQAGDLIWLTNAGNGGGEAKSGSAYPVGSWYHLGMKNSAAGCMVYVNGVAGTQTGAGAGSTPPSDAIFSFGAWWNTALTRAGYAAVDLAFWGAWTVALTADEFTSLASKAHPRKIRPASLSEAYSFANPSAPGNGIKGLDLTDTGTTASDSPGIFQ